MPLIFDSHLDLAWCAVFFNRDLTLDVPDLNAREAHMTDEPSRGRAVLSLPELRASGVAICVATLLARGGPNQNIRPTYKRTDLDYATQSLAYSAAHAQLAWYRLMESQGQIRLIRTAAELVAHWKAYQAAPQISPLGVIQSMEGADPIVEPEQVAYWWEQGLRACGPAHYGQSHYAYGTGCDGPLSERGVRLLAEFSRAGMILDVTHLSDKSFYQALDCYTGPLLASHHNCRALVPGDRQLSDDQLRRVVARGGVIGAALDAWMLTPGWVRGVTQSEVVGLTAVADHIDHVCQLAGSARQAALGTDLDGGFGFEQTPRDLKRYRDLQLLAGILSERGYSDPDVNGIFHGNWLRFFAEHLPAE